MDRIIARLRFGDRPWSVRAYLLFAVLTPVAALALTPPRLLPHVVLAGLAYIAIAVLFAASRNDWVRFAISAFHFILSGLVLYGLVFILPGRNPDALFPLRVVLIFGAALVSTALLWHPDTGRWVLAPAKARTR